MEFLVEYGLFLARAATILVFVLIAIGFMASMGQRKGTAGEGNIEVKSFNETLDQMNRRMKQAVHDKRTRKADKKAAKKAAKAEAKAVKAAGKQSREDQQQAPDETTSDETTPDETTPDETQPQKKTDSRKSSLFVIDFEGDLQASRVANLREEITAVLSIAGKQDEVLVRIESPGGVIHGYGLAASQLQRVRNRGIPLTVAVDKVAASGGYMMACIANRIIAAPFALLGSIGVVAQVPNFHRFLQGKDIDVEVMTAGEYKRTLTLFGENTEAGREKFQSELDDIHLLFKDFVSEHRPAVDMTEVGTGEAWYGRRALERHLVDELKSSDEYMVEQAGERNVFVVKYVQHKSRVDRLMEKFTLLFNPVGKVDSPHTHIQ